MGRFKEFFGHDLSAIYGNRLIIISVILLFCMVVIVVVNHFPFSDIQNLIENNQKSSWIVSFLAIFLMSVFFVPTTPLTFFIAVLIEPLPATMVTSIGNTLSAFVHYIVGREIGVVANFEEKRAKLPFKLGNLPVSSPLFLLAGRAIPGGVKGLSFVCGAYRVPRFLYIWTTLVTNMIGAAFIAYGGEKLLDLI